MRNRGADPFEAPFGERVARGEGPRPMQTSRATNCSDSVRYDNPRAFAHSHSFARSCRVRIVNALENLHIYAVYQYIVACCCYPRNHVVTAQNATLLFPSVNLLSPPSACYSLASSPRLSSRLYPWRTTTSLLPAGRYSGFRHETRNEKEPSTKI